MAIVRQPGTDHYYRSVRQGDKVKRVYVGCGDVARLAAFIDEHRRLKQRTAWQAIQVDRANWNAVCAPLDELIAFSDLLVTVILVAEGYHRHCRGPWRRRRW